ncbi:MAG: hypothetical protein ACI9F2_000696 [Lysobacterales bacterium]|jgi:hypothetical protein
MFKKLFLIVTLCACAVGQAQAGIFISEFLADVSTTQGDANADGIISATHDEFVELFNATVTSIDLEGWSIHDSRQLRHVFDIGDVIFAGEYFVVFGGGAPTSLFETASTGTLSLNNSGDHIQLFDSSSVLVDEVIYGSEANHNEALVRSFKSDNFVRHSQQFNSDGALFSPGTSGQVDLPTTAVPEPLSFLLFASGIIGYRLLK